MLVITKSAAQPKHIKYLPEIERTAASLFPLEILPNNMRDSTTSLADFEAAQQRGMLWVAEFEDGLPIGFAIADDYNDSLHLDELDVNPEYQHQGVGGERWWVQFSSLHWRGDFSTSR